MTGDELEPNKPTIIERAKADADGDAYVRKMMEQQMKMFQMVSIM